MSWNYRVMREISMDEEILTIREVYYEPDKETLRAYSFEPNYPMSTEGLDGLRWTLQAMLEALDKPIVEPENFPSPP